ncbi:MAG: hypothetical protein GWP04_07155 [Gammaproteobacteria bacterium]|nr:hypothetical protein [Gammaproteobacteria bacterium]
MRSITPVVVVTVLLSACGVSTPEPVATPVAPPTATTAPASTTTVEPVAGGAGSTTTTEPAVAPTVTSEEAVPVTTVTTLPPERIGEPIGTAVPSWFVADAIVPVSLEAAARTRLATDLNVSEAEVAYLGAMLVQWPNSALGCPEKGMVYLQVITDGYLMYFQVGQNTYSVHTDTNGNFVVCSLPGDPQIVASQ